MDIRKSPGKALLSQRNETKVRVAAILTHPVQYLVPLMRELSRRPEIDLRVYFLSRQGLDPSFDHNFGQTFKWDVPLLDGYNYTFIPNLRRGNAVSGFFSLLNLCVIPEITKNRYDVVLIHGYEHLIKWLSFAAARVTGSKLIFRGESHLNEPRSLLRRAVKRVVLGGLLPSFDAVAYIGKRNREYYEHYGVRSERLFPAPYSVDNEFFSSRAESARSHRGEIKATFGITDDAPVVLFSGKLITVKQPAMLLQAFAKVRRRYPCHLLYVGEGELRPRLEEIVRKERIPDVHFAGFVNQSRIPGLYASADLFVLPSIHEPWGLVVNEAMACGLPIIASDRVGSAVDLIRDGFNGYTYPYDNCEKLGEHIERLVASEELRARLARGSSDLISSWTVQKAADGIVAAVIRTS